MNRPIACTPALAERVRAANYTNGDTFQCGAPGSYLYAYEIEGAPFREGYNLGSRAQPTPVTQETVGAAPAESGVQEASPTSEEASPP